MGGKICSFWILLQLNVNIRTKVWIQHFLNNALIYVNIWKVHINSLLCSEPLVVVVIDGYCHQMPHQHYCFPQRVVRICETETMLKTYSRFTSTSFRPCCSFSWFSVTVLKPKAWDISLRRACLWAAFVGSLRALCIRPPCRLWMLDSSCS